ncbi:hypothetical protein [Flavivirga jejuensis]|uniref:Secretin/TonB short N-terminal domain-containing protein n=1 Tax=Flavivirga jejuensis TaxID=870487 RepID=A0ABT8WPZ5_9FLAO|nr:hypothetical protein [Flavivirga jejuensis]MDO5975224.1 hypothetical protein [Flavivirga jejuensis]
MKNKIVKVILCLLFCNSLIAQNTAIKYNSKDNTLSVNLNQTPITKVIDELIKQGLQLYILSDNQNFKVSGVYANTDIDRVLSKIIPKRVKYFYKVISETKEKAFVAKSNFRTPTVMSSVGKISSQKGDKNGASDKNKPQLKSANKLIISKPVLALRTSSKIKDPFKVKNAVFKNSKKMKAVNKITPVTASKIRSFDKAVLTNGEIVTTQKAKKHLVVTYRVTENGISPVSLIEANGEYASSTEVSGNQAIIGVENGKAVLVETFENPLTYRAIFEPGVSDHKEFTATEAYINVSMPIKYKSAVASEKLELKMVRFKDESKAQSVLQKVKAKELKSAGINASFQVLKTAQKADFSKLKKSIIINN